MLFSKWKLIAFILGSLIVEVVPKNLKVSCSFVLYFDMQDLQVLECIEWEAIIIDKCQRSKMSKHFEQIRMLAANMRLLLISGQIKVRISITNIICYASSN